MTPPQAAVTVDCFVRASSLVDPIDATVETLREYDRAGTIDDLDVRTWPDELVLSERTQDADVVTRYRLFEAWADEHGARLDPAFTTRERTTLVDDGTDTVLVPPVTCLAIHVDGELATVVPHRTGAGTYAVGDALDDLAVYGYEPSRSRGDGTADARTPSECPACGAALVTGQGLYACPTCDWSAVDPTGRDQEEIDGSGGPPEDADERPPLPQ